MRKIADSLGTIFGVLSMALLVPRGLNPGIAAPFKLVLDFYEKSAHQLVGWAEPYLIQFVRWAGFTIQLHPLWKHVLLLMWLYFGVVAKVIWPKFKSPKERSLLVALTAWGLLLAFVAAMAAGTIDLVSPGANGVAAVFPLLGFALYQLAWAGYLATIGRQENWWNRYRAAARLYLGPGVVAAIVVGLTLIVFAQRVPGVARLHSPALGLLFGLTVLLAAYWLWTGVEGAVYWHKAPGNTFWQTFRDMTWRKSWNTRIGLAMLRCIGGGTLFVLLGAGLE